MKTLNYLVAFKFCLLITLILLSGCTILNNDECGTTKEVPIKNYFDIFSPSELTLDFNSNISSTKFIDKRVINLCTEDFRRFQAGEIILYKVLKYKDDIYFYTFNVKGDDDTIISYAFDLINGRLIYKFYVPMA